MTGDWLFASIKVPPIITRSLCLSIQPVSLNARAPMDTRSSNVSAVSKSILSTPFVTVIVSIPCNPYMKSFGITAELSVTIISTEVIFEEIPLPAVLNTAGKLNASSRDGAALILIWTEAAFELLTKEYNKLSLPAPPRILFAPSLTPPAFTIKVSTDVVVKPPKGEAAFFGITEV